MKKTSAGNQTLDLNRIDFERAEAEEKRDTNFQLISNRVEFLIYQRITTCKRSCSSDF
jgi:hypothetical protein